VNNLKELKPRKALNKAFLKVKPNRTEIEGFKTNLITLLDRTNDTESEEFHKNLVSDFLKKTYYDPHHFINTKGRNDLVIHNGQNANSTVGVILEAKKPTNKSEMITTQKLNAKAFQELVLYYLRERITHKNLEVKHLVATNINEWFIFDATLFERLFAQNKSLVKQFTDFEAGRLADSRTDFFYKQVAEPFIDSITAEIEFTYFNIQDFHKPLRNTDKADDNSLIALFKLLSPEHLLKLPFTNDSNSLDKRFYSELLHIIGLTETKDGSKKLIERNKASERHTGTILEAAIIQLDSLDKINRLEKPNQFGNTQQERLFNVALELSITWINRILFLKLLEAQLITYHKGDKSYAFLNLDKIKNYDDLNSLFFQVLARKDEDRNEDVKQLFAKVPYLNSSLFEPTDIEQLTLFISNLKDDKAIPIFSQTVLKDQQGKKRTGSLSTLHYLFAFLDAYDFGAEGGEEIQEDNKTLINASVLGLIFEKINGYKDGSFFTPGFITMYMCRETIRKAVLQKFNETKKWNCTSLEELYDKIEDRKEANNIVNSIKICDPAVGSGHFLVSALNEMIAVKNDLKILQDRDGKRLKEYQVEVVNDELIVTDEEGELFEYNPNNKESQRIQETLFHEKQTIIENCLFGVDINANSVKICRLRLWIELLKNAYYIASPALGRGTPSHYGQISSPDFGTPSDYPQSSSRDLGSPSDYHQSSSRDLGSPSDYPQSSSPNIGEVSEGRRGGYFNQLNNLPYLKTFRKELRNNLTPAEAKLWTLLKGKQMEGRKFRRQHSFGNYILDFYCPEERIAIELDGQGHFEFTQAEYDRERDLFLEHYGIRVLRFENKWVWDNPEGLLERVRGYFNQPPRLPSADTPPYQGGEQLGMGPSAGMPLHKGGEQLGMGPSAGTPLHQGGEHSGMGPSFKGGGIRELQTLPNIDINIKCGNSLVSRFAIDADLKQALKKSKWTIDSYKIAVDTYRNAENKEQKRAMERLIADIKSDFRSEISKNDPKLKKLYQLNGELVKLTTQQSLFELSKKEKADWNKKVAQLTHETKKLEAEIEEIKANKIFENAFEWRFEFPEVLNADGDFVGFDVVIGNPPYLSSKDFDKSFVNYLNHNYTTSQYQLDLYVSFIERGINILKSQSFISFITPNSWLKNMMFSNCREFLLKSLSFNTIFPNLARVFDEASVDSLIFVGQKDSRRSIIAIKEFNGENHLIRNSIDQDRFKANNRFVFDVEVNDLLYSVIEKIRVKSMKLENVCEITRGVNPYDKYRGQSPEVISAKAYHANYKKDETFRPEIRGKHVYSYSYNWDGKHFISYGDWLAAPRDRKFFSGARIIMRQVLGARLNCTLIEEDMIIDQSVFIAKPYQEYENYTHSFLAILASRLIVCYFKYTSNEFDALFPKIKIGEFKELPIPLDFKGFNDLVTTDVKLVLDLKKQDPSADTSYIESKIDQLVYQFYELTEEEVKIIENN
jgi:very-short-patch-repair endonuclease